MVWITGSFPDRGVDHQMIEGTSWPVGVEIMFHVGDAFAIDGIDLLLGLIFGLAHLHERRIFSAARSVKENVEG